MRLRAACTMGLGSLAASSFIACGEPPSGASERAELHSSPATVATSSGSGVAQVASERSWLGNVRARRGRLLPVSVSPAGDRLGDGDSIAVVLAGGGRFALFTSFARNLTGVPDDNEQADVFLRDLWFGTTRTLSVNGPGYRTGNGFSGAGASRHVITPDGRFVVFESRATDLVNGVSDANGASDVFVRDTLFNVTELVSRACAGQTSANGASTRPVISDDGRFVVFASLATDLIPSVSDENERFDLFVRDRLTQTTSLLSADVTGTATGNAESFGAVLSGDGRFVAFSSEASNLVGGVSDENATSDVFLRDLLWRTTTLVSRTPDHARTGDGNSTIVDMSNDGTVLLFHSSADDLVSSVSDENDSYDVFSYDRLWGTTTALSTVPGEARTGNGSSFAESISADGAVVAFASQATDLVASVRYATGAWNVFARARFGGVELVSADPSGTAGSDRAFSANGVGSFNAMLSWDGRFVVFESDGTNLSPCARDDNDASDVFVRDRLTLRTRLVSVNATGDATGNNGSSTPSIASDGASIGFHSFATDLVSEPAVGSFANAYTARNLGANPRCSRPSYR